MLVGLIKQKVTPLLDSIPRINLILHTVKLRPLSSLIKQSACGMPFGCYRVFLKKYGLILERLIL